MPKHPLCGAYKFSIGQLFNESLNLGRFDVGIGISE
jgi:hypothetical protein